MSNTLFPILKKYKEIILLAIMASIFYIFGILYVFFTQPIFPILNGIILLINLFLFRGKYRLYAITFYLPATKFMSLINTNVGSFLTWNILIYLAIVLFNYFFIQNSFSLKNNKIIITFLFFFSYMLVIDLINIKYVSLSKFISVMAYLALPLGFFLDSKSKKDIHHLLFLYALGFIMINSISVIFIYSSNDLAVKYLEIYIPRYVEIFQKYGKSFRYPGMAGDPNHLSLYILFISSLIIIIPKKNKVITILYSFFFIILQFFGVLGGSKTYLIGLVSLIILAILLSKKIKLNKLLLVSFTLILGAFSFAIILHIPSISKSIYRILFADDRLGFLESISTQRFGKWINYIHVFIDDPLLFLLGHGVEAYRVNGFDYHNTYLQLIWEYGIFGTLLFINYIKNFLSINFIKKDIINLMPLMVLFIFSMSLHITYSEGLYVGLFIFNLLNYNSKIYNDDSLSFKEAIYV